MTSPPLPSRSPVLPDVPAPHLSGTPVPRFRLERWAAGESACARVVNLVFAAALAGKEGQCAVGEPPPRREMEEIIAE